MKKILKTTALAAFLLMLAGGFVSCKKNNCDCIEELGWSVRLTLRPQADENYLATEDPEIQALVEKHDVTLSQTSPGAQDPKLLLCYAITGKWCNKKNKENAIKDFLATGKFEDDVYEYGYVRGPI